MREEYLSTAVLMCRSCLGEWTTAAEYLPYFPDPSDSENMGEIVNYENDRCPHCGQENYKWDVTPSTL
jgi:hypothetical protein